MLAMTVKQPWADAIGDGIKPVENRRWAPRNGFGQEIAIHAALEVATENDAPHTPARYTELAGDRARPLASMARGKVVAVGRLAGAVHIPGDIVRGQLSREDVSAVLASPWTIGPWALVIRDVQRIRVPVDVSGRLGLWEIPASVEAELRRQLQSS